MSPKHWGEVKVNVKPMLDQMELGTVGKVFDLLNQLCDHQDEGMDVLFTTYWDDIRELIGRKQKSLPLAGTVNAERVEFINEQHKRANSDEYVSRLENLVNAVKCNQFSGALANDIEDTNWFDYRDDTLKPEVSE